MMTAAEQFLVFDVLQFLGRDEELCNWRETELRQKLTSFFLPHFLFILDWAVEGIILGGIFNI